MRLPRREPNMVLTIRLPESVHRKCKLIASKQGLSMQKLMADIVNQVIELDKAKDSDTDEPLS